MPLSGKLLRVDLTFNCPHCHHAIVKSGGWFQTIGQFKCKGCKREVRLTYADKGAVFEKHAHLIQRTTGVGRKR
jgi:transposase-like protein